MAATVAQILEKLRGPQISSKERLSRCQEVASTLPASPHALASFSTHGGVSVLLQQLGHSSTSTSLLTSVLKSLTFTFQSDEAYAQVNEAQFWSDHGEVFITEAVGFVLAGQADPQAISPTLFDYLAFVALVTGHSTAEQQMQLLRVSQGTLKQAAQIMQDNAEFQQTHIQLLHQLLQLEPSYHIDGLEVLKGSKLLRTSARAVKVHGCNAAVFHSAVQLLTMLLTTYRDSSCYDALIEEIVDSGLPLEAEIAVQGFQASDVRQEGAPAPTAADFKAATGAQHQIQEWQAQHQDMLHTDVMQAMDESSDSESMIVESNQVNMHASSSALGSFHAPATDDFSKASDPIKLRETSEGKAERHGPKGFFSMLTRALKRS